MCCTSHRKAWHNSLEIVHSTYVYSIYNTKFDGVKSCYCQDYMLLFWCRAVFSFSFCLSLPLALWLFMCSYFMNACLDSFPGAGWLWIRYSGGFKRKQIKKTFKCSSCNIRKHHTANEQCVCLAFLIVQKKKKKKEKKCSRWHFVDTILIDDVDNDFAVFIFSFFPLSHSPSLPFNSFWDFKRNDNDVEQKIIHSPVQNTR